jgi:hypothetical protein
MIAPKYFPFEDGRTLPIAVIEPLLRNDSFRLVRYPKATLLVNGGRHTLAVSGSETRTTHRYATLTRMPKRHSPSASSVGKPKNKEQK